MKNNLQVIVNDMELELDVSQEPVALTLQINDVSDIKNQNGTTTNQFKFPWTARNRRIWNFANDPNILSSAPYTVYPAKIIQDGLEIVPVGKAELKASDTRFGECLITTGNVDFFDYLEKKLPDLDFSAYDHIYDGDFVASNMANTYGVYYPLINYGQFRDTPNNASGLTDPTGGLPLDDGGIRIDFLRPAIFVATIVDVILAYTGYTATGSILSDPLYQALIVPCVSNELTQPASLNTQIKNVNVKLSLTTTQQSQNSIVGTVLFSVLLPSNARYVDSTTHGFLCPIKGSYKVNINIQALFVGQDNHGIIFGNAGDLNITFTLNRISTIILSPGASYSAPPIATGEILSTTVQSPFVTVYTYTTNGTVTKTISVIVDTVSLLTTVKTTSYPFTWATTVNSLSGDNTVISHLATINLDLYQNDVVYLSASADLSKHSGLFSITAGTSLQFIGRSISALAYGDFVQMSAQLPDMTAKDFLKDIFQKFGVIIESNPFNKTVHFGYISDITNNIPNALDWSGKFINADVGLNYSLQGYFQNSYFLYKNDQNLESYYCRGGLGIDDETLPLFGDYVRSQFGASNMQTVFNGINSAIIEKIDPYSSPLQFNQNVNLRLLISVKYDVQTYNIAPKIVEYDASVVSPSYYRNPGITPYIYSFTFSSGVVDLPSFNDPNLPYNLDYAYLLDTYYSDIKKILTRASKIKVLLQLTEFDITGLSFFTPVWIKYFGAYFYINKIEDFVPGLPTNVELIKLY